MSEASHSYGEIAWNDRFLSRIDPRIKIVWVATLLLANLLADSFTVSAAIAAAMVLLMVAGRIPYRRQLIAIAFPVSFATFAVVSQMLFNGSRIFASLGPVDLHSDGLAYGLLVALRIVAGGLVVVLLGVTTPINRLCLAMRWFHIPALFVEVLQLSYRYLFDIYAEFFRMREAQRSRLGWSSSRRGMVSGRLLGGVLFMRVYDRSLRSAEAMRSRGSGSLLTGSLKRPGLLDLTAAIVLMLLLAVMVLIASYIPASFPGFV